MNKNLKLLLPALLLAAFCLPALAQDNQTETSEATLSSDGTYTSSDTAAKKPAAKKTAAKKKKKKKPAEPASEYKFTAAESVPTYKFDRKANPIVKETKKKPAKKSAASKKKTQPAAKLKPSKPIGAEETPAGSLPGVPGGE
jgi:outer membrane biosynthesis protein TonB